MLLQQAVWSLIRLLVTSTTLLDPGDSNIYIGPAREPLPKSFQWSATRLEAATR